MVDKTNEEEKAPIDPVNSFLDELKKQLDSYGVFNSLRNPKFKKQVLEVAIPPLIDEFINYSTTAIPVLDGPEDYGKAISKIGDLQQRLDRISWAKNNNLAVYNQIRLLRENAANYIQVNLKEVKSLKSKEMRDAAANYILFEFNDILSKLDEFYSIIEEVKTHINRAIYNIRLQLDLHTARMGLIHTVSSITNAGTN